MSRNELTTPVPDDVPQNISNDSSSTPRVIIVQRGGVSFGEEGEEGRDAAVFPEAEKILFEMLIAVKRGRFIDD